MIKRSVSLRGHRTSLALEPEFWSALDAAASERGASRAGLIAAIDDARAGTGQPLSSAVRVWLLRQASARSEGTDTK